MSVFIKGMEMPNTCWHCMFRDWNISYTATFCEATKKRIGTEHDALSGRLPDCPLVEVSVPHGRLIDADKARCTYMRSYAGYNIPIIEAETVLKAEGKEDG